MEVAPPDGFALWSTSSFLPARKYVAEQVRHHSEACDMSVSSRATQAADDFIGPDYAWKNDVTASSASCVDDARPAVTSCRSDGQVTVHQAASSKLWPCSRHRPAQLEAKAKASSCNALEGAAREERGRAKLMICTRQNRPGRTKALLKFSLLRLGFERMDNPNPFNKPSGARDLPENLPGSCVSSPAPTPALPGLHILQ